MMGRSKLLTWSSTAEFDTEHKTYLELKKSNGFTSLRSYSVL